MTVRIVSRLLLVLVALAAAATLVIGALSVLASTTPADAAPMLEPNQARAVERAVEAPAGRDAGTSATPVVALVFAGIVLMAALPPVHRVHVYHGSYRPDWH
jgi:hypothetical protein